MGLENFIDDLLENVSRFAIILKDGLIIRSIFSKNQNAKLIFTFREIISDLKLKIPHVRLPWVFYRITDNVIIVLQASLGKNRYLKILTQLDKKYSKELEEHYQKIPNRAGNLMKYHTFACARDSGPEPIATAAVIKDANPQEDVVWRYAMSSLLILVNQTAVQKRDILAFHPFLEHNELGLVFLFRIPLEKARGGYFDASLFSVINFENRARVYGIHEKLERIYKQYSRKLSDTFKALYGDDIDAPIYDQTPFIEVLNEFQSQLEELPLQPLFADQIRDRMIESIAELETKI